VILLALLLAAQNAADAERVLAAQAGSEGGWAALRAAAAPDAILYTPRKVPAAAAMSRGAETGAPPLGPPLHTWTSCDGTLAYAVGTSTRGYFGTLWRQGGGWQWIYAGGHDGGGTPQAPTAEDRAACPGPIGAAVQLSEPLPDTPLPIAALTRAALAGLVAMSDGRMPATLRLGGIDAEGASADRTLRWRIDAVVGARAGAHLLRLWSWDGRRYRLAVLDVTGTVG
jgi:hypothetical protein